MCTRRNGGKYSMKNTIVNNKERMATYRVRITFGPLSVPECVSHSRGVKQAGGHARVRDMEVAICEFSFFVAWNLA
jgi:hypothetical protein